MTQWRSPFTEEEMALADSVPLTSDVLLQAARIGTRALSDFGFTRMQPVFAGQLKLTDRETAFGMCFYRLIASVRTLADLDNPYHFQLIGAGSRTSFELCVDINLLAKDLISDGVEKFHQFTRAARFSVAYKTVEFFKHHPGLEQPGDAEERRALVEVPGAIDDMKDLCQRLWGRRKAPEHWSGLRWSEQVRLLGPDVERQYTLWSGYLGWLVHGGGAGVGGLPVESFKSLELVCRHFVKFMVPEAYRLVAVEMHMHRALPQFFDELDRVRNVVETYASIDARLQMLGHRSKLA